MIKRIIKRFLNLSKEWKRAHDIKSNIAPLINHSSPVLNSIGSALYEALANVWDEEENIIFSTIEARRSFLANCDEAIDIMDYGAGSPDSGRTKEEMENGIPLKMPISHIAGWSKPTFWAIFLHKIHKKIKPLSCLELGTCLGISAAYQASALNLNGGGKLTSLEGSPLIAKIAEQTLEQLKLDNFEIVVGPFHKTLSETLEAHKPIDFFFNDGHHDHDAVLNYFSMALPNLAKNAIVVLDDISWSDGMRNAWSKIVNHEKVASSIDLGEIGIIILGERLNRNPNIIIDLPI